MLLSEILLRKKKATICKHRSKFLKLLHGFNDNLYKTLQLLILQK